MNKKKEELITGKKWNKEGYEFTKKVGKVVSKHATDMAQEETKRALIDAEIKRLDREGYKPPKAGKSALDDAIYAAYEGEKVKNKINKKRLKRK